MMQTSRHTIAIIVVDNKWEWTLFDRDAGAVASGVAKDHDGALASGWSAARQITPASTKIYPEITLACRETPSFSSW